MDGYSIDINEVVDKVLGGNCMLFLGSGFSAQTTNLLDEKMPTGNGLAKMLDAETGEDSEDDLEDAAESYIGQKGWPSLAQKLRETFTAKTLTNGQNSVCKCKWRRVYTTNYDNSFELGKSQMGEKFLGSITNYVGNPI